MTKNTYTRREMLKMTGLGIVGTAIAVSGAGPIVNAVLQDSATEQVKDTIPFYGKHQPGIATPPQTHCYFATLQFVGSSKEELKSLFKKWTEYSARLMEGKLIAEEASKGNIPPVDTGDSMGLPSNNLTLTFGVGPSLFEHKSLNLSSKRPELLKELPHFPKDQLQDIYNDGDLCIQACADDPQVAFHAVRNLVRAGSGIVKMKWSQAGFLPKTAKGETPRNLFSFKDGTVNPKTASDLNEQVWVKGGDQQWLENGTYLVYRRIQMHLETWDRTALKEQEATFGRKRESGAFLTKKEEFEEVDIHEKDALGNPVIPEDSHVFLAKAAKKSILRRSYSYSSGLVDETGAYDAGLMFISFQKDPEQFIAIQNSLGRQDRLNEYITHRGSAIFACFPGVKKGSYIGEALFASL